MEAEARFRLVMAQLKPDFPDQFKKNPDKIHGLSKSGGPKIQINSESRFLSDFVVTFSLFRNEMFMLDKMFEQNASKFAMFLEYENPCTSFFRFSFRAILFFLLTNALFIDQRIH